MAERKPLVITTRSSEFVTGGTLVVPGHFSGAGAAAPTGVTTKALTIGLSANVGGQTVYWHCLE